MQLAAQPRRQRRPSTTLSSAHYARDHSALVVYNRDGRRPECVYIDGMDLSVLDSDAQSLWRDYLTPDERARAAAARANFGERARFGP